MHSRFVVVVLLGIVALAAGVACGGGGSKTGSGDAAAAVAEFWKQEQAGGVLPEGTSVLQVGVQSTVKLSNQSGEKARYCVVFQYLEREATQKQHARVYVASLKGDAWTVESVKPDGTCDGVS